MRGWFESVDPGTGETVVLGEFAHHVPLHEWVLVELVGGSRESGGDVPVEGVWIDAAGCSALMRMRRCGMPALGVSAQVYWGMVPLSVQHRMIGRHQESLDRCVERVVRSVRYDGKRARYRFSRFDGD